MGGDPVYWHIDTDIISLLVIAAIYIYNVRFIPKGESFMQWRRYLWCLRIGILVTMIDIAASVAMETPVSRFVYHLLMTLDFAGLEITIVFWLCYCMGLLYYDDEKRRRRLTRAAGASYVAFALFAVSNPWTGAIYTLGPNNEYQRGPLFFLMVAVYVFYTLVLTVLVLLRRKRLPAGYSAFVLVLTPVIVAASIAAQLTNEGWLMILPGYMFSMVLAFLFLQSKRSQENQMLVNSLSIAATTDPLTGAFNRTGMKHMVELLQESNRGERCLVIVVDIDDLKVINDGLGHPAGDSAICGVATLLKNHFRTTDIVARFGGDEFVVYLIGDMSELHAHRKLKQLLAEVAGLRVAGDRPMPVRVSVGATFGTVGSDGFEQLCARADRALYHIKRHGKHGYAFYEPFMSNATPDEAQEPRLLKP